MLTLPDAGRRKKQSYLAIRSVLTRRQIKKQGPLFLSEVRAYMQQKGFPIDGPAFYRTNRVDADGQLEMEFGYITQKSWPGFGPVKSGTLPSGRHASTVWTGPHEQLDDVMALLIGWGKETGLVFDVTHNDRGDAYANRIEVFENWPGGPADSGQWVTEIAIKLAGRGDD